MIEYDLVVIGSGPGGQKAAVASAKLGKKVAVIERSGMLGGVCVNTGTIPSKSMREAVVYLTGMNQHEQYGASYRVKQRITFADLHTRTEHVIKREIDVVRDQLMRNGIGLYTGIGRFVDDHTVSVENPNDHVTVSGQYIIIATGTRPSRPAGVDFDDERVVDSDGILNLKSIPHSMVVVGAGVIGIEYASMFAALGTEVTVVEKRDSMLDFCDPEIVEDLRFHLRDLSVTFHFGEEVTAVDIGPDGTMTTLASGKKIPADTVMYLAGRQGCTENLDLGNAGLEADSRGRIAVDTDYRTKQPHIFAVGDIIGFPSLGSVSMEQGRIAAANAFGIPIHSNRANYPYGIYTIPEISFIGKTEEQLTEEGVPYEVGIAFFREIARGQIRGDTTGRLKLIFDPDSKELLGVHIVGEGASELLHIGQAVFAFKGTVEYFADAVFNYPTLAECYKAAAFNGLNKLR